MRIARQVAMSLVEKLPSLLGRLRPSPNKMHVAETTCLIDGVYHETEVSSLTMGALALIHPTWKPYI